MTSEAFLDLSAAARGLLWSIWMWCWKNDSTNADPDKLARVLSLDRDDVIRELPAVLESGMVQQNQDVVARLYVEKLADQKRKSVEYRMGKIQAGSLGGQASARANRDRKPAPSVKEVGPAHAPATPDHVVEHLSIKSNSIKSNSIKSNAGLAESGLAPSHPVGGGDPARPSADPEWWAKYEKEVERMEREGPARRSTPSHVGSVVPTPQFDGPKEPGDVNW